MIRINLLPVREARRRADLQQQAALLAGTLAASLLLVAALHWSVTASIATTEANIAQLNRQIDAFGAKLEQVESFKKKKAEIEKKLSVIDQLDRSRSGPVHVLDELATRTPERMWLTKLEAHGREMSLEGMSLDNELVAAFLTALGASPYFENVELERTELQEKERLKLNHFKLRAALATQGDGPEASPAARAAASGR